MPVFELTETCLGQRLNRPGAPSLRRKILSESSTQLSDEDDAERRLSDETRTDDHDLASKVTFESESVLNLFGSLYLIQWDLGNKPGKTLPALSSAISKMCPEMPRSHTIALKDDPSFDLGNELSPQVYSPSPSSSRMERS